VGRGLRGGLRTVSFMTSFEGGRLAVQVSNTVLGSQWQSEQYGLRSQTAREGRRIEDESKKRELTVCVITEHHLYKMIASYLKSHPTTEQSPLKLRVPGLPMPKDNKVPTPAVPRGFKMGNILPLHSPALTGGGVSDNMMADMMKELGGAGGMPNIPGLGGMGGMGGGAGGPPQVPSAGQLKGKGKKK